VKRTILSRRRNPAQNEKSEMQNAAIPERIQMSIDVQDFWEEEDGQGDAAIVVGQNFGGAFDGFGRGPFFF